MKRDAAILLNKLSDYVKAFANLENLRALSNIDYGNYLKDMLVHTACNYTKLVKYNNLKAQYKRVLAVLPGNIPLVAFQLMPIALIYNICIDFKLSNAEKRLLPAFLSFLASKDPQLSKKFGYFYIDRNKLLNKIREYDFVFLIGSDSLKKVAKDLKKPFRFFGPKFSIGFMNDDGEQILKGIAEDNIYFDTEGCLSLRILFVNAQFKLHKLIAAFKAVSANIPPASNFNADAFIYNVHSLFGSVVGIHTNENSAIIELEHMVNIWPKRTLFVKRIRTKDEVLSFLGNLTGNIQAISGIYNDEEKRFFEQRTGVSFFSEHGRLQYPPASFLFDKGITIENIMEV